MLCSFYIEICELYYTKKWRKKNSWYAAISTFYFIKKLSEDQWSYSLYFQWSYSLLLIVQIIFLKHLFIEYEYGYQWYSFLAFNFISVVFFAHVEYIVHTICSNRDEIEGRKGLPHVFISDGHTLDKKAFQNILTLFF